MKRSLLLIAFIVIQLIGFNTSGIPIVVNTKSTSNSNDSITIIPTVTDAICTATNGSISIEVEGGVPPYIFNWTGPDGFTSNMKDLYNLNEGTFTLTVSDSENNSATESITIELLSNDVSLTANINPYICGGEGGKIMLMAYSPYQINSFSWTGPNGYASTSQNISNLEEGVYTVIATDTHGCTGTLNATVYEISPISINIYYWTFANCDRDGSIILRLEGDTTGYKYSWTGPDGFTATTPDISGLKSGLYTCVITDKNGCTKTLSHELKNLGNQPPVILNDTVSAPSLGDTNIDILSNDNDPDGTINLMSLKVVNGPLHGSIRFSENGNAIYTPRSNYIGPDIFSYQICDNGVPCGEECDIAYVYIDVQRDTIPPSFEGDLPDLNFECLSEVPDPFSTLDEFNQSGMVATDNFVIDPDAFSVTEISQTSNCITTLIRAYLFIDFSGNVSSISHKIVIEDTQDPTLKCPPNVALSLDHSVPGKFTTLDAFVAEGGSVIDNCEIDAGSFFNMSESIDTLTNSILIRRAYYAEDYCRNGDICLHQIEIETETNSLDLYEANDFHISVYPNPSSGQFSVEVQVGQSSEVQFEIVDMNGKSVYNETHPCTTGTNLKDISLQNIAQGTYMLKAKSGRGVVVEKVVVL